MKHGSLSKVGSTIAMFSSEFVEPTNFHNTSDLLMAQCLQTAPDRVPLQLHVSTRPQKKSYEYYALYNHTKLLRLKFITLKFGMTIKR